ncbi:hypothetical protein POPTR_001G094000v4 [Populus trichocarpa]|jgi:hypothetical protein|uniref:Uncharacterized protein n=1 Tax=Populus trichocarpa TaxID=3694 RepID=B9GL83_POPTR|nr:hypothetical protein POPTR_001G094000v4 [Populus trichocarpa]
MEGERKEEQAAINVWDCGSPLYDSYEIASLGHLIDRHSLALSSPCGPEKEGRAVIDHARTPRDQEKGLEVKKEGLLSKIIRIFFWKRTIIRERNDHKAREPGNGFYCLCAHVGSLYT